MKPKTKALLLENLLIDAQLILGEVRDLKINLSIELQAIRDDRHKQAKEFAESMTELENTLHQIRAKHLIEAQLLDLIKGPDHVRETKTK